MRFSNRKRRRRRRRNSLDGDGAKYTLQLNIYAWILEHYYGERVVSMHLVLWGACGKLAPVIYRTKQGNLGGNAAAPQ